MTALSLTRLAADLLRQGYAVQFRAPGRSMAPTLADGVRLLVEPLAADAPVQVGDIVLARLGDRLLAHRVVAIEGSGATARLVLRGDAQRDVTDVVRRTAILGKARLPDAPTRSAPLLRIRYRAAQRTPLYLKTIHKLIARLV